MRSPIWQLMRTRISVPEVVNQTCISDFLWIFCRTLLRHGKQSVHGWTGWISCTNDEVQTALTTLDNVAPISSSVTENATVQNILQISQNAIAWSETRIHSCDIWPCSCQEGIFHCVAVCAPIQWCHNRTGCISHNLFLSRCKVQALLKSLLSLVYEPVVLLRRYWVVDTTTEQCVHTNSPLKHLKDFSVNHSRKVQVLRHWSKRQTWWRHAWKFGEVGSSNPTESHERL